MDGFSPFSEGDRNLISNELINYSALMNIDTFAEICSPSTGDQVLSHFNFSTSQKNFQPNARGLDNLSTLNPGRNSEQNSSFKKTVSQPEMLASSSVRINVSTSFDDNIGNSVPRTIVGISIEDRLLKALSLLKASSGGGILAQIWMPFKHEDGCILSTSEQPFLLDQNLAGYREVSRTFTFSGREAPDLIPGLPARVFLSGVPEWTSNIIYYNRQEYLRVDHAIKYNIHGSLALPIYSHDERSCCAVLELVTKKEKPDFDAEIDNVCDALKVVDLRSIKGHFQPKNPKMNQRSVFAEILDMFRALCHAHMLPLALTWVPITSVVGGFDNPNTNVETILCIQESACYVNDEEMQGFLHACSENHLRQGQGAAGKAIMSNQPVFSSDIKMLNVKQYPLAHHARRFLLHAAVAIRLRSTYTGNEDYVLEFFLPNNCTGSAEQQLLLNNLSVTLQKICRSLRTVSDVELVETEPEIDRTNLSPETTSQPTNTPPSESPYAQGFASPNSSSQVQEPNHEEALLTPKVPSGTSRRQKKPRNTVDKTITLGVLQQHYSGTLKAAAKSIGVCPTTLKRICRMNGISRWPSRKINKVNHSVQKIQTVIDSVPGVVGTIKYDFTTGKLITEVSSQEKETIVTLESPGHGDASKSSFQPVSNNQHVNTTRNDGCHHLTVNDDHTQAGLNFHAPSKRSNSKLSAEEMQLETNTNDIRITSSNWFLGSNNHPSCSSMTDSSSGSASSDQSIRKKKETNTMPADPGLAVRVKATYKEDTVRFKFFTSMGINQLLEEVGKRFKLPVGTFQLKYKDDEDEWVILINNDDLDECIEMLESTESPNLKLLVRDVHGSFGSSTGSNSMFM